MAVNGTFETTTATAAGRVSSGVHGSNFRGAGLAQARVAPAALVLLVGPRLLRVARRRADLLKRIGTRAQHNLLGHALTYLSQPLAHGPSLSLSRLPLSRRHHRGRSDALQSAGPLARAVLGTIASRGSTFAVVVALWHRRRRRNDECGARRLHSRDSWSIGCGLGPAGARCALCETWRRPCAFHARGSSPAVTIQSRHRGTRASPQPLLASTDGLCVQWLAPRLLLCQAEAEMGPHERHPKLLPRLPRAECPKLLLVATQGNPSNTHLGVQTQLKQLHGRPAACAKARTQLQLVWHVATILTDTIGRV
eukprot:4661892-Prymnesium_polylepis.3